MSLLAFFNLGPAELIVLGAVFGLIAVVATVAVLVVTTLARRDRPPDDRGD